MVLIVAFGMEVGSLMAEAPILLVVLGRTDHGPIRIGA
jgi:hypothetical protein